MAPTNFLFICSDQHNRAMTGCYGHPLHVTPHLDGLAARGTRFTNAYTNSPICMPVRAALATGRYVHQINAWDNAHPYAGATESWHHRLRSQGFRVDSIGKLHFRGDPGDDNGFTQEHYPLYRRGAGDVPACLRGAMPPRTIRIDFDASGPGDSSYLRYDRRNTDAACDWINGAADTADPERPWAMFLGIGSPHTPFICPPEFDRFDPQAIPLPPGWHEQDWPHHPAMEFLRDCFDLQRPFSEDVVRRANATYLGLCSFVDHQVGRVLQALADSGQQQNTRVIYTTDHGESMGARGIVGKFTMYDESAAIPMLMAGPGVPENHAVQTPVSLVDVFPTALDCVGADPVAEDADLPGRSLLQVAAEADQDRTVLSEYHAIGSRHAAYMLRDRQYKYIHYHNDPAQLYADEDTDELTNLAEGAEHADVVADMEARLCAMLDPEAVDQAAKKDQKVYAEARADDPVQWPTPTDGPTITYTTIPPELDPAFADDPATQASDWRPTRDLPDGWVPSDA